MHFFLFLTLFLSMIFFWDDTSKIIDSFGKNRSVERMPGYRLVNDPSRSFARLPDSEKPISQSGAQPPVPSWFGIEQSSNPIPNDDSKKPGTCEPNQTMQIRFSILFFFISFILLTSDLISRWFFSKHIPLSNLYESLLFLNFNFIGIYFFFIRFEFNQFYVQPFKEKIRYWFGRGSVPGFFESSFETAKPNQLGTGSWFGDGVVSLETDWRSQTIPFQTIRLIPNNPAKRTEDEISLLGYSSEGTQSANAPNPDFGTPVASQTPNQPAKPMNHIHESMSHEGVLLGPLLSSTVLFIQCFADWRLPDQMKQIQPLIPALQSNWLLMHVSIMIISYAALFLGSILAITYLGIHRSPDGLEWLNQTNQQPPVPGFFESSEGTGGCEPLVRANEPTASARANQFFLQLDSLSYRILAFGFPLLTLGILSGAIWANEAWGSYWSWDPKETWAFITWLVFAFYLHTRLQYNWQGIKSAYVATGGFFIVWICYLGVNLLGQGLHSYGWINS